MDISTDGTALYVVNYESHTMSKIRTRDLTIRQELDTAPKPIGITESPRVSRCAPHFGGVGLFELVV